MSSAAPRVGLGADVDDRQRPGRRLADDLRRFAGLLGKLQTQGLRFGHDLPQARVQTAAERSAPRSRYIRRCCRPGSTDRASGQTRCQAARSTTPAHRRIARAPGRTPTLDRDRNSDQTRTERPCSQRPKCDAATLLRFLNRADLHARRRLRRSTRPCFAQGMVRRPSTAGRRWCPGPPSIHQSTRPRVPAKSSSPVGLTQLAV